MACFKNITENIVKNLECLYQFFSRKVSGHRAKQTFPRKRLLLNRSYNSFIQSCLNYDNIFWVSANQTNSKKIVIYTEKSISNYFEIKTKLLMEGQLYLKKIINHHQINMVQTLTRGVFKT